MAGYVRAADLRGAGDLTDFREFSPPHLLDDTAGLKDLLACLAAGDIAFVRVMGTVTGLVGRRDLEKPPMRMWLFGIISLLEMNVTWAVRELYPANAWVAMIAHGRVEKARALQAERKRRGRETDLLSCLQFSDKLRVLIKDERHRELFQIGSRRTAEKLIKRLESLRNNLAHAQPVVDDNWEAIQSLGAGLDSIVSAEKLRAVVRNAGGAFPSPDRERRRAEKPEDRSTRRPPGGRGGGPSR
jgi:hypothetical protein